MNDGDDISPEWRGLLAPGERILWQGAPQRGLYWGEHVATAGIGGALALTMALLIGPEEPLLALAFVVLVAVAAAIPLLWGAFQRRHSFYTLTDRQAVVGLDLPVLGRRLRRYPLDKDRAIRIERGPLSHVFFLRRREGYHNRHQFTEIGFKNLLPTEAEDVYRLLLNTAKGKA